MREWLAWTISMSVVGVLMLPAGAAQDTPASWLDRPLSNWNRPAATVPVAPATEEPIAAVISRCKLQPPESTTAERAVKSAGWIPFWNVDQQLVRDDVEIVSGMRAADGMCRPETYQLFVFVSGRFAGTLSPTPMNARQDASSGVVRLAPPVISTEFARYGKTDPLCCPSSRVTVRYSIERAAEGPLVVPTEIRTTRG